MKNSDLKVGDVVAWEWDPDRDLPAHEQYVREFNGTPGLIGRISYMPGGDDTPVAIRLLTWDGEQVGKIVVKDVGLLGLMIGFLPPEPVYDNVLVPGSSFSEEDLQALLRRIPEAFPTHLFCDGTSRATLQYNYNTMGYDPCDCGNVIDLTHRGNIFPHSRHLPADHRLERQHPPANPEHDVYWPSSEAEMKARGRI